MQALRRHAAQGAKFAGVGVLNTAVDFGVFLALQAVGAHALGANLAAFLVANGFSYVVNSGFTFRKNGVRAPLSAAKYLKFLSVHLASLAISSAFIALLSGALGALVAKMCAAAFTLLWNYVASAFLVFRKSGAKT